MRLTARLKRQILLNNIFGVDIDAQAVEVTRFSLSLKALEETRRDELYEERDLFRQTVLPESGRGNIQCGNSLLGRRLLFRGRRLGNKSLFFPGPGSPAPGQSLRLGKRFPQVFSHKRFRCRHRQPALHSHPDLAGDNPAQVLYLKEIYAPPARETTISMSSSSRKV